MRKSIIASIWAIDSGKNRRESRMKVVMQQAGVTHIDHVVSTHYHKDHYGGIDDLDNDPEITIFLLHLLFLTIRQSHVVQVRAFSLNTEGYFSFYEVFFVR